MLQWELGFHSYRTSFCIMTNSNWIQRVMLIMHAILASVINVEDFYTYRYKSAEEKCDKIAIDTIFISELITKIWYGLSKHDMK